jgi:FAD/FMN-containing dehydrogenase
MRPGGWKGRPGGIFGLFRRFRSGQSWAQWAATAWENGMLEELRQALGAGQVLTGPDTARYRRDWMGKYDGSPVAVIRPGSTAEVAAALRIAAAHGVPVVPVSGNTGLVGGTMTQGGLMVSLERLNRIRAVKRDARLVVAEAGVILSRLH